MRNRFITLLSVALIAGVLTAAAASANDFIPIDEIYEDTTLTEDHMGGVVFKEDNITLDCDGYSLIENHESEEGVGILMEGRTGLMVKNCRVSGFLTGVMMSSVNRSEVKNTTSSGNEIGFVVRDSSSRNMFKHNDAKNSLHMGFWLIGSSNYNTFKHNTSNHNGGDGFECRFSTNNKLSHNTASRNAQQGFSIGDECTSNILRRNAALHNNDSGFAVFTEASNNRLVGNIARHNDHGFAILEGSVGNELIRNRAVKNQVGFFAWDSSPGNILKRNTFCHNSEFDLGFSSDSEPELIHNKVCDQEDGG